MLRDNSSLFIYNSLLLVKYAEKIPSSKFLNFWLTIYYEVDDFCYFSILLIFLGVEVSWTNVSNLTKIYISVCKEEKTVNKWRKKLETHKIKVDVIFNLIIIVVLIF